MALVKTPFPMTEAEIDRLEELLESDAFKGEAMLLDELQGFLCAIASGPEPVLPHDWLPVVLGESPRYETEAQADEVLGLLMRFFNQIAEDLHEGNEPALILYPVDAESRQYDYAPWADGYLLGSEMTSQPWFDAAGKHAEELADLLDAFFLLNGSLREEASAGGKSWLTEEAEARATRNAEAELPGLVLKIYRFWRSIVDKPQADAGESAEIGNNDACPCGSGRKFKQCCGSPERLH